MSDTEKTSGLPEAGFVLEEHFGEIFAEYERRLEEEQNLLTVGRSVTRDALERQARSLLGRAAKRIRGEEPSGLAIEEEIQHNIEAARAPLIQHPDESFRAGMALCRAALETTLKKLDLSKYRPRQVAEISLAIQESVMDHIARVAMVSYVDYLLAKISEVQIEERQRFSRELHDRIAHSMALVNQSLELHEALKERSAQAAEDKLRRAREASREAMVIARDIALELRHADTGEGLGIALNNLVKSSVPPGVEAKVAVEGDEKLLPTTVRDQLYMTLREGIRNAFSHSGSEAIAVEVSISPQEVTAIVADRGEGFEPSETRHEGVGLRSMQERAHLLRGSFDLSSAPGEGTRVKIRVPLRKRSKR